MPQLQQILEQVAALKPDEREQLVLALCRDPSLSHLSFSRLASGSSFSRLGSGEAHYHPSIVSTPGVCGGAARLIRTRIPVWTIERMRQLGLSDLDILRSFPTLRAIDLVEASSYAACHREEIEKAIRENEEDDAEQPTGTAAPAQTHH